MKSQPTSDPNLPSTRKYKHDQQVDLIIDVLLDTAYTWIGKYTDKDTGTSYPSHLSKDTEWKPICSATFSNIYTLDKQKLDPDDYHHEYDLCQNCLKLIRKDPTRYGFHEEGIYLYAELSD